MKPYIGDTFHDFCKDRGINPLTFQTEVLPLLKKNVLKKLLKIEKIKNCIIKYVKTKPTMIPKKTYKYW